MPFRFCAQPIGNRGEVGGIAHRLGEQTVFARYFVERRHRKRVVDQLIGAGGERAFDACDYHVEVIEGADRDLPCHAALRRFDVDVVELLEAGRIFEVAEQRQPVLPIFVLRLCRSDPVRQRKPPRGKCEHSGRKQGSAVHLASSRNLCERQ